jgi:hypothetical protein
MLYVNSLAQGRTPDTGESLDALASSFAYVLDTLPTQHLEECFKRAMQHNTGDFLLTAGAVTKEYQDMLPELQRAAAQHANEQTLRLEAGYGSLDRMGIDEWKTRHNLPAAWRLGEPYPPESDLCGAPVPRPAEVVWDCNTCHDARWVKDYSNGPLHPELRPCPRCGF